MTTEHDLCKTLCDLMKGLFTDIEIRGNWLLNLGGMKGVMPHVASWLEVIVSPRAYENYTTCAAAFEVELHGEFPFSNDTTFEKTSECYEKLITLLEEWRHDINAVKRDLTITSTSNLQPLTSNLQPLTSNLQPLTSNLQPLTSNITFDPVGLNLTGGTVETNRETKVRTISQNLTIKGRILK